jgi:acetyl-CoA carboxylase biotin carboxylase subunit
LQDFLLMTISRLLIANRGEIAVRIIHACQALGIDTVLAVSDADRESASVRIAGRTVCIGPAPATDSYLNVNAIIAAAVGTESDAVHPGYGFLAESPQLAEACAAESLTFVGPTAAQIRQIGNKLQARALARECGVPVLSGSEEVRTAHEATAVADRIGFPVMLKAAAGGGGRGMKVVTDRRDLGRMFSAAAAEARSAFGDDTLYLERFIPNVRHIEVQVLGDRFDNILHLGERDCSLQRRHQKMVEEAPAPDITSALRQAIRDAAVRLGHKVGYENAGTVEFLVDQDAKAFFFLEMNTRIQVEHPVTEMITGIDLVQEQLRIARGERLRFVQSDVIFRGHAIECRVNAESPEQDFRPHPGRIAVWCPPEGPNIRLDTHCYSGYTVPMFYDSLIGKLIVYGSTRAEAIERMRRALEQFVIVGIPTTLPFLKFVMTHAGFVTGNLNTRLVDELIPQMFAPSKLLMAECKKSP